MIRLISGFAMAGLLFYSCVPKYPLKLGKGYKLDYDGNSDVFILNDRNTVVINSHVYKYCFDSNFIVAEQKPREIISKVDYNKPNRTLDEREKIFNESPIRRYWIINKINDSIYMELTKEEFEQKKELLRIPKGLKLVNSKL